MYETYIRANYLLLILKVDKKEYINKKNVYKKLFYYKIIKRNLRFNDETFYSNCNGHLKYFSSIRSFLSN